MSMFSVSSMADLKPPRLIGSINSSAGFEGTLGEAWGFDSQKPCGWRIRKSTVSGAYSNVGVTQGSASVQLVDTGASWGGRVLGIGIWRFFDDLKLANYITMDVTLQNPAGSPFVPDNWIEFDIEIDGGVGKHLLPVIALSPIPETPQTYTLSFPIPQAVRDSTGGNWGDLYIRVTHGDQGAAYWIDNVLLHFDTYVPPAPPAFLAVAYTVKTEQDRAPISPYIYGSSVRFDIVDDALTMMRFGGNHTTPYNWETNYSNAGKDWYHSSGYANFPSGALPAGREDVPGSVVTHHVDRALARNLESLVTLPMAGYVAADKNGVVTEAETAPSARWKQTIYRKNAPFCNPPGSPDRTDNYVYSDEFVNFLVSRYGNASTATGVKFYALCNEPVLWSSTHPRIHPWKVTGAELIDRSTALASAVKDIDPYARIFGPVFYAHWPMHNLQNTEDWETIKGEYSWFVDFYLDQMKQASNLYGARLMDVFTFHHYSHTNDTDTSEEHIRGRMQAPRFLWDPSYNSNPLLPRIQNSINTYNPGTGIAVTEWAFGGYNHVSGGIATADVLGVWGKYGLFAASYWTLKTESLYPNAAYRLYRNYDGSRSTFGDTKISASLSNRIDSSLYASTFAADPAKVSMIVLNKNMTIPIAGTFTIDSPRQFTSGRVWAFDAGGYTITERTPISSIAGNTFTYEIPPLTACHIVLVANEPVNTPPAWSSDPVIKSNAVQETGYSSTLADDAADADGDLLTFAKVSGPAWLTVAPNGALSGTPGASDIGLNTWTVAVTDGVAPEVSATLNITVIAAGDLDQSGCVDIEDLVLLAFQWLETVNCSGPGCPDLSGDTQVNQADFALMAANWLCGDCSGDPTPKMMGDFESDGIGTEWQGSAQTQEGWKVYSSANVGTISDIGAASGSQSMQISDTNGAASERFLGRGLWRIWDDLLTATGMTMDITTAAGYVPDGQLRFDIVFNGTLTGWADVVAPAAAGEQNIALTPEQNVHRIRCIIPQSIRDARPSAANSNGDIYIRKYHGTGGAVFWIDNIQILFDE
jgi:hypothetical protein